ncbi:hypothetical protein ABI_30920 [Asticcacaulis biprosthecium C19]|uniref:Uncharacterized protein n=1 Tax=Asticcacaulis biprosthecium C19 TaxID=715226 RepID=F4QN83_9CAUL|nr:hypothetical protein [Asticcacaulis biprosthecium]EGF91674.1 hypothetical protein ABI_30920 [Asticcacaulis biprosthecium C19]
MIKTEIIYDGRVVMTLESLDPKAGPAMQASVKASLDWRKDPGPAPEPAREVERFEIVFTPPDVGCIDCIVTFDAETVTLPLSQYGDPFEDIKVWLERLAGGEFTYELVCPEGWLLRFGVAPDPDPDYVLFTIWERWCTDETKLDCHLRLKRETLVATFYNALLEIWEKPDPESFWWEWDYSSQHDEDDDNDGHYGVYYYHVRSPIIDAYLAREAATE